MQPHLVIAWIVSALAGSAIYVALMFIQLWPRFPSLKVVLRFAAFATASALVIQLAYGGLLYVILKPLGLFRLPLVVLAYLVPVFLVGWRFADTTDDLLGMAPWLAIATALAAVFWFLAR
jgi:hypothetical protein